MSAGEEIGGRGKLWRSYVVRGLLVGLLGLFALFWPSASLAILVTLVGLFLLADGVMGCIGTFRAGGRGVDFLQPAVTLVVGAILLFWPGTTLRVLLIIFGAWAVIFGVGQVLAARKLSGQSDEVRFMTAIGATSAIVGMVLILWPGSGVVAISWVIALAALVLAALFIGLGLRMRRLGARLESLRDPGR